MKFSCHSSALCKSLVRIEGASDAFIADQDGLGLPYLGEVLRVSLSIDAEASLAGAAFHVGYIRTANENGDDKTSVAEHPLFQQTFQGAPLVDPGGASEG